MVEDEGTQSGQNGSPPATTGQGASTSGTEPGHRGHAASAAFRQHAFAAFFRERSEEERAEIGGPMDEKPRFGRGFFCIGSIGARPGAGIVRGKDAIGAMCKGLAGQVTHPKSDDA